MHYKYLFDLLLIEYPILINLILIKVL